MNSLLEVVKNELCNLPFSYITFGSQFLGTNEKIGTNLQNRAVLAVWFSKIGTNEKIGTNLQNRAVLTVRFSKIGTNEKIGTNLQNSCFSCLVLKK